MEDPDEEKEVIDMEDPEEEVVEEDENTEPQNE
jgi:hypothetical protein